MKRPFFSIVVPTYNSSLFILQALNSIRSQNFDDYELIIVDGNSQDETVELIERYIDEIDVILTEPDLGAYDAMNKGIQLAKGRIIKILSSDDLLEPGALNNVFNYVNSINNVEEQYIVTSSIWRISLEGVKLKLWKKTNYIGVFENYLHPSWFVPRQIYHQFGLYSLEYSIASDYEYFLRLVSAGVKVHIISSPLVSHRAGGISENYTGLKEIYHIKRKYHGLLSAYLLLIQSWLFQKLIIIRNSFL